MDGVSFDEFQSLCYTTNQNYSKLRIYSRGRMAKTEKKKDDKKVKKPSRLKRLLQSQVNRERNKAYAQKTKTAIKKLESAVAEGSKETAQEQLNAVFSVLDKAVKKGMLKLNKASRDKARATRLIAKIS
jgi:small subunit ribosomal protein S20